MSDLSMPGPVPIPLGIQLQGPDVVLDGQMLMVLGAVVRAHSTLDLALRILFCALTDSKYAAITSAGQATGWLVDACKRLVARRDGLSEDQRDDLLDRLKRADAAVTERNRLIHDLWAVGQDGSKLMRSQRKTHQLTVEPVSLDRLMEAYRTLGACTVSIISWGEASLGPAAMSLEATLRFEDR